MAGALDSESLRDGAALALEAFQRGQAAVAAGNRDEGRRWLDRACRLAPRDQTLALALATACLGQDDVRADALFASITNTNDVREAWLGLATARWRLGDIAGAAGAVAQALQRHVPDPDSTALAEAITQATGAPGWCGLSSHGELIVWPKHRPVEVRLDGRRVTTFAGRSGRCVTVTTCAGEHLLGSPIDLGAITATTGCVSARDGGLVGWAWHPGDPDIDPVLTIRPAKGRREISLVASDTSVRIDESGLLARPRGFVVAAETLQGLSGLIHVFGRNGKDLLGSPLDPCAEQAAAGAAAATLARLYPAARQKPLRLAMPAAMPVALTVPRLAQASRRRLPADVVVPVHGGKEHVLACLESVLATLRKPSRLIVVDDASPDPKLVQALNRLAKDGRIRLIRHERNQGFAASANAGMRAVPGRDVVLLNSDTLTPPGWLDELRAVAYSASDIGTVTPFSNDATILSYPSAGRNDLPDMAATVRMAKLAWRANGGAAVEIPVGVGFCMYIRRACLDAVGLFRADVFAQGYGEENDFCLRARHLGWRHVAAPGAFVAHVGGHSFGSAARHLQARNKAILERLHPGSNALIEAHVKADPLAAARRRLDLARWRAVRRRGSESVILITHAEGGGVERQVKTSALQHQGRGLRVVVLRPGRTPDGKKCVVVSDGVAADFPNLRYTLPDELPGLQRLLAAEQPRYIELHHLVGHDAAVLSLVERLAIPYDVRIHDYAWLCARVALVGPAERYCGEPCAARCDVCVAEAGNLIDEDIPVAALRERSARVLAAARHVFAPSQDTAARIRRHFPSANIRVQPHENDAGTIGPLRSDSAAGRCRICVIGSIGIHKGYRVLLDCARDAAERRLPVEFVVVGHTIDDRRLMATGRVFVTGSYRSDEAIELIRAQEATLALLPSIFPETWCFTLAEAWRAGLQVVAFDIGAQAERIRNTGRGHLLPLGLAAPAINNALLAAAGLSRHE